MPRRAIRRPKQKKNAPKQPNHQYNFDFTDFATLLESKYTKDTYRITRLSTFYRTDLSAISTVDIAWKIKDEKMNLVVSIMSGDCGLGMGRSSCGSLGDPFVLAEVVFDNEKFTDHTVPKYFQTKIIDKVKEYWTKSAEFNQKVGGGHGGGFQQYYYDDDIYQKEDL